MNNVVRIDSARVRCKDDWDLKNCRREYGLSINQAAKSLDLSSATYERMEQGRIAPVTRVMAESCFGLAREKIGPESGNNLIFGKLPLRVGRQITGHSVQSMAAHFGYSVSTWKKFESNGRTLDAEKVVALEKMVKSTMDSLCISKVPTNQVT